MAGNHFKLHDDKTEFVIIRQNTLTQKITGSKSIVIGNATISTSDCVKNIGAILENQVNVK